MVTCTLGVEALAKAKGGSWPRAPLLRAPALYLKRHVHSPASSATIMSQNVCCYLFFYIE